MQLLEIEKELLGPDGEAAMQGYDRTLADLGERLARAQQEGLAPDDFTSADRLKEAVVVARKLLRLARREAKEVQ